MYTIETATITMDISQPQSATAGRTLIVRHDRGRARTQFPQPGAQIFFCLTCFWMCMETWLTFGYENGFATRFQITAPGSQITYT